MKKTPTLFKNITGYFFALFALIFPAISFAQGLLGPANNYDSSGRLAGHLGAGGDPSVTGTITWLISAALIIAGSVALAMVIYGGFRYLTAGGNESAAEAGKKTLLNAIIGFVIISLAWVILYVIQRAILTGNV